MRYITDADIVAILGRLKNPKTESGQLQRLQNHYYNFTPEDKNALIAEFNKTLSEFYPKTLMFFLNLTEKQANKEEFSLEIAKECVRRKKELKPQELGTVYDSLSMILASGKITGLNIVEARILASKYCYLALLAFSHAENTHEDRQKEINDLLEGSFLFLTRVSMTAREYLYRIYMLGIGVEANPEEAKKWFDDETWYDKHVVRRVEVEIDPDAILAIGEPAPLIDLEKPMYGSPVQFYPSEAIRATQSPPGAVLESQTHTTGLEVAPRPAP